MVEIFCPSGEMDLLGAALLEIAAVPRGAGLGESSEATPAAPAPGDSCDGTWMSADFATFASTLEAGVLARGSTSWKLCCICMPCTPSAASRSCSCLAPAGAAASFLSGASMTCVEPVRSCPNPEFLVCCSKPAPWAMSSAGLCISGASCLECVPI